MLTHNKETLILKLELLSRFIKNYENDMVFAKSHVRDLHRAFEIIQDVIGEYMDTREEALKQNKLDKE